MKTIRVKGIGKASARPDYVVLTMKLASRNMEYQKAMDRASDSIGQLTDSLVGAGLAKSDVKTTGFRVDTEYESVRRKDGSYEDVFRGYVVVHDLKAAFDLDSARLGRVLSAVSDCTAHPRFSIAFTVKDAAAINEEMLRSAAENARRKAEILCEASGKRLGELLSIDYSWDELDIYSNTRYDVADECLTMSVPTGRSIEIEPEDIDVSDTAAFVWEIV